MSQYNIINGKASEPYKPYDDCILGEFWWLDGCIVKKCYPYQYPYMPVRWYLCHTDYRNEFEVHVGIDIFEKLEEAINKGVSVSVQKVAQLKSELSREEALLVKWHGYLEELKQ